MKGRWGGGGGVQLSLEMLLLSSELALRLAGSLHFDRRCFHFNWSGFDNVPSPFETRRVPRANCSESDLRNSKHIPYFLFQHAVYSVGGFFFPFHILCAVCRTRQHAQVTAFGSIKSTDIDVCEFCVTND